MEKQNRPHYFGKLRFVKVYFQGSWALILFFPGRSHGGQLEQLKPDVLLRLTLGGLTLTLLQDDPPSQPDGSSSLAQVSQVFFRELGFFKDSMFSERDFHHLKVGFAKACPLSHLRYRKRKWNFLHRHRWSWMNNWGKSPATEHALHPAAARHSIQSFWCFFTEWRELRSRWPVSWGAGDATIEPSHQTFPSADWNCWNASGRMESLSTLR